MENLNYNNCLRPTFTKRIFEKILSGRSINPFGIKGIGKKRLLDDLAGLAVQANIKTLRIDLKAHRLSYTSFLSQIETQLLGLSEIPQKDIPLLLPGKMDDPVKKLPSLNLLIHNTQIIINQPLLILFDNFDALIETLEHTFPEDFFINLNALKGTQNITLCCTSTKSQLNSKLYFEGGRKQETSILDLEPIDIPVLTMNEIRTVLNKRLHDNTNWKNEAQQEIIVSKLSEMENILVFINLLVDDFTYYNDRFEKRLKRCKRQYRKRYQVNHRTWISKRNWEAFKRELKDLFTIGKDGKKLME